MAPAPAIEELVRLLEHGSPGGRLRAVRVLGAVPEAPDVRERLAQTYAQARAQRDPELQGAALASLIALGGAEVDALLPELFASGKGALLDVALARLAERPEPAFAELVRELLERPWRAETAARGLLAYYRAFPHLVDDEIAERIAQLASSGAPEEVRLAVLQELPRIAPRLGNLRRVLAPLSRSAPSSLREEALVALALLGDKAARREVLEPYDRAVDQGKRRPEAWARRAAMHARIGDDDSAIRDYRESLEVGRGASDPAIYLALARCCAREHELQDAAQWLRRAPITLEELRALAADPEFAELAASKWGREAFALGEAP
jgi:hypothetical protein